MTTYPNKYHKKKQTEEQELDDLSAFALIMNVDKEKVISEEGLKKLSKK